MDPKKYRQEMLAKIEGSQTSDQTGGDSALSKASTPPPSGGTNRVDTLMERASDASLPVDERLEAIKAINGIAFDLKAFQAYNARYVKVLKELRSDKSKKVRQAAFKRLALSMDPETRTMLQSGLASQEKALVPEQLAVTLLSTDDHASSRATLRQVVETGRESVRNVALRGLAPDAKSAGLLERIAMDRNETAEIREAAALSLKSASPERFAEFASKIAVDLAETDRVRATAIGGLAHSTEAIERIDMEPLLRQLDEVSKQTKSSALRSSIKRLKSRTK